MLNIHPALLPNFGGKGLYGGRVHKAVIASGARFSGVTVHFVDEGYDTGPILAQAVVPVYPTDSPKQLAARVLQEVCTMVLSLGTNGCHNLCNPSPEKSHAWLMKPGNVQEHELYPKAVAALVDGRITWRDDGIPVLWSAH